MLHRTSYHTYIKLLYLHGKLGADVVKLIPASTRYNWNNYDYSRLFGMQNNDGFDERLKVGMEVTTNKKLYQLNRTLIYLKGLYQTFCKHIKNPKELFNQCSRKIVEVVEQLKKNSKPDKILTHLNISKQQYDYWKRDARKCSSSIKSICRIRHPHQLTVKEVKAIKNHMKCESFQHWPAISVYYKMLSKEKVFFSLSTFYNYCRWLGFSSAKKKFKKKYDKLRAIKPFEKLHMDVTIFRFPDNTKAYIYLIVDNFSRAILNWKVSTELKAGISFENLREAFKIYNLYNNEPEINLIVDGGSENKKEVDDFIDGSDVNMKKFVAQVDITHSNSMVEAINKALKHQYLYPKNIQNRKQLCENIDFFCHDFHNRPHGALYGLTPMQALNGEFPAKDHFKNKIISARTARIKENQQFDCTKCMEKINN